MTTYFVAAGGNDASVGTTEDAAWQTVERVNATSLQPGDTVLFKGGDVFADDALMPNATGVKGAPVTFGSYGMRWPSIPKGAWFIDREYLTFDGLSFGPDGGVQGGNDSGHFAHRIVVRRCSIDLAGKSIGVLSNGDQWQIVGNTIQNTGDSGLRLEGDDVLVYDNRIRDTGLDASIPYGKHGIYLLASNAQILHNDIRGFSADGVSARRRNSTIEGNQISGGAIGIGFFQYDGGAALSRWTRNYFADLSDVGIWVSPEDEGGPTAESFQIGPNAYSLGSNIPERNLSPTTGVYLLT